MPVFSGARIQRGHGLGSILGGFFRRLVLSFVKNNAKNVLSNAVKTGMEVADDVLEGRSLKESAKRRVPAGIKKDGARTEVSVWIWRSTREDRQEEEEKDTRRVVVIVAVVH